MPDLLDWLVGGGAAWLAVAAAIACVLGRVIARRDRQAPPPSIPANPTETSTDE